VIKCVQCGLVQKPALRCERCNALLERPDLSVPAPAAPAAPAPDLLREIALDRRAANREPPAAPAPPPARRLPIPPLPAPAPRPAATAPPVSAPAPAARPPSVPAPSVLAPRPAAAAPVSPAPVPRPPSLPAPRSDAAAVTDPVQRPLPAAPVSLPPAAAASTVQAGDAGVTVFRASPASLLKRTGAWIVDALLISLVLALYLKIAQSLMAHPPPPTSATGLDFLVNRVDAYQGVLKYGLLLGAMVGFVYSALFHALGGRTPGKRLFGIRLVDRSGRAPTLWRCVLRAGLSLLSFALLLLGFLYAGFDRRRQALHDKLTATFVVRPLSPR
jgi:uncharacterized RDD family membrane protein YckC